MVGLEASSMMMYVLLVLSSWVANAGLERREFVSVRSSRGLYSSAKSLRSPADSNANKFGRKIERSQWSVFTIQTQSGGMYTASQPASQRSNAKRRMSDDSSMVQDNEERVA